MPLDVVLVGAGRRGLEHIELISSNPDLRLRGVYDRSPAQLLRAGLHSSTDLAALLAETTPQILVLATPPAARLSIIEQVIQQPGLRAVVIEKPLALSVEEADRILALCGEHAIVPFVFHQLPLCPEFARLRSAIADEEIGALRSIAAYCYGNLFDQGSHMVDLLGWLVGPREPRWVMAQGEQDLVTLARTTEVPPQFVRGGAHPGPPWMHAVIGFSDQLQATLSCGLLTPVTEPALGPWLQKRVVAIGTDGIAEAHVASHFRMLTPAGNGWVFEPSDETTYREAQQRVYAAVVSALDAGQTSVQSPARQRTTIEILVACQQSESLGQAVTLPPVEATSRLEPAVDPARRGPRVSVILPMEDDRGLAAQALRSWTLEQRCDPDDFEVVVLSDDPPELGDSLKPLLRPQDRIVRLAGNGMAQCHAGAKLARGDILFFTEAHCLAEPETIGQTIEYLDSHAIDGLCARTVPLCMSPLARAESRVFSVGFEEWSRAESWVKVIMRGFAIRRTSYFAVGGFEAQYDRFSEWLLAARLRAGGYEIAYAPGVGIHHKYGDAFKLFDYEIERFTRGECLFRLEDASSEFTRTYFGSPPEWTEARSALQWPVGLMLSVLMRLHRDAALRRIGRQPSVGEVVRAIVGRVFARQRLLLRYTSNVWRAQLRFWLSLTDDQRYAAFAQYYEAQTWAARVRFALRHPVQPARDGCTREYRLASVDGLDLVGFHPVEAFQGQAFRWCGRLAGLRLRLDEQAYAVTVQLVGARPIEPRQDLAVLVNDVRVDDVGLDTAAWQLRFTVPARAFRHGRDNWLVFYCDPWRHPDLARTERRQLGLPIREVRFSPVAQSLP